MDIKKNVKDIFEITLESYEYEGHKYTDTTLKTFIHPILVIQLLTWQNNAAHIDGDSILICSDWNTIPENIIREMRMTLFTLYNRIIKDEIDFDKQQQCYILEDGGVTGFIDGSGSMTIPDSDKAKKLGSNHRKIVFPRK